jgi:antitoxin VapB
MNTVKINHNGAVQNIQLPTGFQFDTDEVEILRRGDEVILRTKQPNLREAFDLLASMPDDFFAEERRDPPPETREAL